LSVGRGRPLCGGPWTTDAAIRIESLSKTYAGGKARARRRQLRRSARADLRPSRPERRGQVDADQHPRRSRREERGKLDRSGASTSTSIRATPSARSASFRRRSLFDPFFTPKEALEIQAGLYGIPPAAAEDDELLAAMHLTDKAERLFAHLVGRHEAAAAGRQGDGPFAADPGARRADRRGRHRASPPAVGLCPRAQPQGVTVVLTTHYLEEAEELCDRIAIINHGRVIANEPTRSWSPRRRRKRSSSPSTMTSTTCRPTPASRTSPRRRADARDHLPQGQGERRRSARRRAARRLRDRRRPTREPDLEDVFLSLVARPSGMSATADVLIVGSGAAGLTAALNLAETHKVGSSPRALRRRRDRLGAGRDRRRAGRGRQLRIPHQRHDDRRRGPQRPRSRRACRRGRAAGDRSG
jgi:ABC-2 type transport system ATP-binding protein